MRHVRLLATLGAFAVVAGSVIAGATAVYGAPTPGSTATVAVPTPQKPSTVCTVPGGSSGAIHITGLGVIKGGYVAVDGQNSDGAPLHIVYLSSACKRTSSQSYSGNGPRDPQDLSVDSNGTIWVADTGDSSNPPSRTTIGVWKVTSKSSSTLYRFSYPDGAQDSAAMLLNGDGTPIFITKVASGPAKLYVPTGGFSSTAVPLKQDGTFQPQQTGTSNKFGLPGQNWVTGAAKSPDGKKVVIRTYSDAYEWDVTNGDVIGAITKNKPRITPLPDDAQGEAITYTSDSSSFLTASNTGDSTPILKWTPTAPGKVVNTSKVAALTAHKGSGGITGWLKSLSLNQLMVLLGGIALFGLLLIVIGILGITRSRKVARDAAAREKKAAARAGKARAPAGVGVEGAVYGSHGGNTYGSAPRSAPGGSYSGGQYGSSQQGGQHSGGQYSGGQYRSGSGGGQYGRGQGGGSEGVYGRPSDPFADNDNDPWGR